MLKSRPTYRRFALLFAAVLALGGCLEDVTVGLDTQRIVAREGGVVPGDAGGEPVGMDGSTAPDAGPIPHTDDSGLPGDSGQVIDAGPCDPMACYPVHVALVPDSSKALICATGEEQVCTRNSAGKCELQCPIVPPDVSCSGGVFVQKCAPNTFCRHDIGDCNGPSAACAGLQTSCEKDVEPVCGCDGVTYDNACLAFAQGVNIQSGGACP